LLAVASQLLALLVIMLAAEAMPSLPAARLILQGAIASLIGRLLRLPYWWVPINLMLPLAVVYTAALALPPWLYLLAFVALLLLQWNSGAERVPLYLSNRPTREALAGLLPEGPGHHLVDIGSALGGTLLYLARRRPDMRFSGIESAPLPYAIAWLRLKWARQPNVRLIYGNFWKESLREYDLLYAFLSPIPMQALFDKAKQEMPAGSLFISNSFTVPDTPAGKAVSVSDRRHTRLYCWRL
jgi:hypothetical protein